MRPQLCIAPLLTLALFGCPAPSGGDKPNGDEKPGNEETFEHDGGTVQAETWARGIHLVRGDLAVTGVLTVEACSELRMDPDTRIVVQDGGALRWIGEESCPIVVESAKEAPAPGDWAGVELYGTSGENELRWVELRHAGQGYGAIWMESGASASIRDTTVSQSGDVGLALEVDAELRDFTGNTLVDNVGAPMRIGADGVASLGAGTYGPNGVLGIEVRGNEIGEDATWKPLGTPLRLVDGLVVWSGEGSAHLTVEAGVELQLAADQVIAVGQGGGLALLGTEAAPVLVTSASSTPAPGDWYGIELDAGSDRGANVFTHAVVEYAGGWEYGAIWVDNGTGLAMTDSEVYASGHFGLELVQGGELRDFTGNTFVDNAEGPVRINASDVHQLGTGTYRPNEKEAIEVLWGSVADDATWRSLGVPYHAPEGFEVQPASGSATLTIEPRTTLMMGPNAVLSVGEGASLVLDGTADAHVTVTSSDSSPSAGDWAEIDLWDTGNVFRYTDFQYGGSDGYGAVWLGSDAGVELDTVTFADIAGCDVSGDGEISAVATTFDHCDW